MRFGKDDFGVIEVLIAISIGLVAWNLTETISLKELVQANSIKIKYLELEKNKGDRFTESDGTILENGILHNRDLFDRHIKRTEIKIDDLHEAIVNRP